MGNYTVKMTTRGERILAGCQNWREVRRVIRMWKREGFQLEEVTRERRRWNWKLNRTLNRHGLRALKAAGL